VSLLPEGPAADTVPEACEPCVEAGGWGKVGDAALLSAAASAGEGLGLRTAAVGADVPTWVLSAAGAGAVPVLGPAAWLPGPPLPLAAPWEEVLVETAAWAAAAAAAAAALAA
jgi:hypothetical protein